MEVVIAFVSDVLHVYMYGCLLGRATRTRYLDTSYHGQLIYVSMLGTRLLPAYFGKAIRASERGWKHQTPVFHAVRVEGR